MTLDLKTILGISESEAKELLSSVGLSPRVYRRDGKIVDYHLPHHPQFNPGADPDTVMLDIESGIVKRARHGRHGAIARKS